MMLKNKTFIVGAVAGAGVAAAALAGAGLQWPGAAAQTQGQAQLLKTAGPVVFAPPPGAPLSFADIIDRVSPAVVSIETRSKVNAQALRRIPGFENFPFDSNPKGQPQGNGPKGQPSNPDDQDLPEQLGAGSGFFISADGYIVTNNHVVEGADEITVTLKDERELKAKVIGRDEGTDLAVIKVEGSGFPHVDFETQARPRVGDWVIAVGNPFGLGGTATAGIVSAYGRDIGEQYVDYIQIDAPINRGNSGGPTFDIYGRVIGVNTAIYSPNGASAGIGFAVPADVAENAVKQLISVGKIERGYLGVTVSSVTEDVQKSLNLPAKQGAYVTELVPGGPSDRAGLKVGDIVTKVNGQTVKDNTDLTRRVGQARPGQTIKLEVLRAGRVLTLEVRSGVRPTNAQLAARDTSGGDDQGATPNAPSVKGPEVLGLSVATLDPAMRRQFSVPAGHNGVLITAVTPHTEAAKRGLKAGDLIIMADNRPVTTVEELQTIVNSVKSAGRPSVLLLVERDGRNYPVPVPFSAAK